MTRYDFSFRNSFCFKSRHHNVAKQSGKELEGRWVGGGLFSTESDKEVN